MYEPAGRQYSQFAFMWPALAAASTSELASLFAKRFVGLALGEIDQAPVDEPTWTTPNTIALELSTVRLRDFSTAEDGVPVLLCAPFALHGAVVTDLAPEHSLVGALRAAGLQRLFVTEWRSATREMRYLSIDNYLADLNVLVDRLGGVVDLVGLCQGGWMSLVYAARFPGKVRKLVLAGAPVDIDAEPSGLTALVDASPLAFFHELVKLGDGRVIGRKVLKFWGPESIETDEIRLLLQTPEPVDSPAFAEIETRFRAWHAWTVDLPGTYYLEVIEKLYRHNEIAAGDFVALGETIDLARLQTPLYLLAARDDELIAPAQLFATAGLVGTPAHHVHQALAPCGHVGLFVGRMTLREHWPRIARWLVDGVAHDAAPAAA